MATEVASNPPSAVDADSEHHHDHGESHNHSSSFPPDLNAKKQNRGEKKIRKALSKCGLKQIDGCLKVAVRKNNATVIVIHNPDVFASPSGNTYVIFGQTKLEPQGASSLQNAADALTDIPQDLGDEDVPTLICESSTLDNGTSPAASNEQDIVNIDESGLNPKDIELVMAQANCPRPVAVKALRQSEGDLVTAIISLTVK